MVDVTVIIPCRNQSDTLERAVSSAKRCGAQNVAIFVDGKQQIPPIAGTRVILSSIHTGVIYARNRMIEDSSTDWIIPLDADDELLNIPDPKDCRPDEFYYGGWIEHYEDGREETFIAPPEKMLRLKPLCHATMMFPKQAWLEIGGYDPDFFFGEDYAFQCALVNAGWNAIWCDIPFYKRYVGKNERTEQAKKYWPIIQDMARQKWPNAFT